MKVVRHIKLMSLFRATAFLLTISSLSLIYLCIRSSMIMQHVAMNLQSEDLYPVIQFNRGGFTKADIFDSSQQAFQILSKIAQSGSANNISLLNDEGSNLDFMKHVFDVEDRKTHRQLLALQALGVKSERDFRELSSLGYENETKIGMNAKASSSTKYYHSIAETVEYRSPDYSKLCFDSAYNLNDTQRVVDILFCTRLKALEEAIGERQDVPLLTIFTWWPDAMSDGEILSRKGMMQNWNLFRPFIVPVVFTNHRMNMAFANGYGWPCFPANDTNKDGLLVFRSASEIITRKFTSTFYGYAKPVAMFDFTLLETLMAVKDGYVNSNDPRTMETFATHEDQAPKHPVIIHGNAVSMPQSGPDPFVNSEHLYKYLREHPLNGAKDVSVQQTNYIFFRGLNFSLLPPVVVHNEFLFRSVLDFSGSQGCVDINASRTLLAIRTFRFKNTNEWGRNYLYTKPPDQNYNFRVTRQWYAQFNSQGKSPQNKGLRLFTRFDPGNHSCVLVSSES